MHPQHPQDMLDKIFSLIEAIQSSLESIMQSSNEQQTICALFLMCKYLY